MQYCDRECQRLHWFMHKKACSRPPTTISTVQSNEKKGSIDTAELTEQIQNLIAE